MKSQDLFDSSIVDTIFYKINEIYMYHATFLAFLERALASWNNTTTIGDVIYKTVSTYRRIFIIIGEFIYDIVCSASKHMQ